MTATATASTVATATATSAPPDPAATSPTVSGMSGTPAMTASDSAASGQLSDTGTGALPAVLGACLALVLGLLALAIHRRHKVTHASTGE